MEPLRVCQKYFAALNEINYKGYLPLRGRLIIAQSTIFRKQVHLLKSLDNLFHSNGQSV